MRLVSAYHLLLSLPSRSLNSRPPHVALSHHVPSPFFCSIADAVTWEYKHRERGEDKRPIDKYIALLITLKRLGTNASFESIALYLGVSVGSAARCVDRMTKAIIDAFEVEIRLPRNTQECAAAAKQFVDDQLLEFSREGTALATENQENKNEFEIKQRTCERSQTKHLRRLLDLVQYFFLELVRGIVLDTGEHVVDIARVLPLL